MAKRKRSNFSRAMIAQYWIDWEKEHGTSPPWGDWDWGEPACMAGGAWQERWDTGEPSVARWNKSTLEKCHVVPLYKGGPDDPSNMVLMCSSCHDGQPDSEDPQVTYEYMRARKLWDCYNAAGAIAQGLIALASGSSEDEATSIAWQSVRAMYGGAL
jgi:hypothetical protein